jgi:hypothetical protein
MAEKLLESSSLPAFHSSELASAFASIEMWNGNDRRATRHFKQSLVAPTENSLAQGLWASKRVKVGDIDERHFGIGNAFEARTLSAQMNKDWEQGFKLSKFWAADEAFSARPYLHGSSLASSLLSKYKEGEALAREGLIVNPNHPGLVNNLAFCLANQGSYGEAESLLKSVSVDGGPPGFRICLLATTGFIEFRKNNPLKGKELYESAISEATRCDLGPLKARAMLYLAREEALSGGSDHEQLLKSAAHEAMKTQQAELIHLAFLIKQQIELALLKQSMQRVP